MSDMGNSWRMGDYDNAKRAWIGQSGKSHHEIVFWKFSGYETKGNTQNPDETFRQALYEKRLDHVWLSTLKGFDVNKGGYFNTGDLSVNSEYELRGFSSSYLLPDGTDIPEYAGDLIQWNGSLWEVADQLEPIQWGYQAQQVFFVSILRRTQRVSINSRVGP